MPRAVCFFSPRTGLACSGRENGDPVLTAVFVPGDEGQVLALGLSDQHSVEWVAVDHRQAPCGNRVVEADRQMPEPALLDPFREPGGFGEFADRLLDGHFPDSRRAHVDVRLVIEPVLDVVGKRGVVGQPPEHDVRVEQQAHREVPKSLAMASLTSRESQSGAMTSLPRSEPRAVRWTARLNGTTLATGVPARLMMISSPCSTRSMIRDRLVFASATARRSCDGCGGGWLGRVRAGRGGGRYRDDPAGPAEDERAQRAGSGGDRRRGG